MRKSPNIIVWLIMALFFVVTLLSALVLGGAYLTSIITPQELWWLPLFGLVMPILIALNVVIALLWASRWSLMALIPIIALAAGYQYIGNYYSFSAAKEYPHTGNKSFKVGTYNVMGFRNEDKFPDLTIKGYKGITIDSIAAFVKSNDIDILCMQEFLATPNINEQFVASRFPSYRYRTVEYTRKGGGGYGAGLAIYSRYPIIKSELISANRLTNGAMYADIVIGTDTVRVFNMHLQSSAINMEDRAFVSLDLLAEDINSTTINRTKDIVDKLRKNYVSRQVQVDSLAIKIEQSPYINIVCGDFNDVPMSYAYTKIKGDMQDSFSERGSGYGYTFKDFMRMLRIDYILSDDDINVITYSSPNIPYSDHNPVMSLMEVDVN